MFTKVTEKGATIKCDVFILPFIFFFLMLQTVSVIHRIKPVAHVQACASAITHIKWRRLLKVLFALIPVNKDLE